MERGVEPIIHTLPTPSRYRGHYSTSSPWPCHLNTAKHRHLLQRRVPKSHRLSQSWQNPRKNETSCPTYSQNKRSRLRSDAESGWDGHHTETTPQHNAPKTAIAIWIRRPLWYCLRLWDSHWWLPLRPVVCGKGLKTYREISTQVPSFWWYPQIPASIPQGHGWRLHR